MAGDAPPTAADCDQLVDAARALVPQVAAASDEIERGRRLPPALLSQLHEARLFRLLLPRSVGGLEVPLATFAQVVEQIGRGDGSAAWCLSQACGASMVAAYLEPAAAQELFGPPEAVLAQGPSGNGRAVAVPGGFRLSGSWAFASGCRHATVLNGTATICEPDGTPRRLPSGASGAESRAMLVPAAAATIQDTWHVSGLRGTASDTFTVQDLFVPEAHTVRWSADQRRERGPLYTFTTTNAFSTGFASVAMGIARGALDAFIRLAGEKTPRGLASTLRESAVVQDRVARVEAQLRAARAFLHHTLAELWQSATERGAFTLQQRALIRLATTYGIGQAAQVVDAVYYAAGATAIFEAHPFERRFRDVHAVTQQIQGQQAHFQPVGRVFLNLDPGPGTL